MKLHHSFLLLVAITSCGPRHQPQQPAKNADEIIFPTPVGPSAIANDAAPAGPQPKATLDPKSTQAATKLVQQFADLLNQRKFDQAYMLLGPGAPPRSDFDQRFSAYSGLRVALGTPDDQEGAAGSIYLSVPLSVSGTLNGKRESHPATAIVRRVNDVPGSTDAERRWHIERIDWKTMA
jgi:hypothetical protein